MGSLKVRVADANKQLARQAICIIGKLIEGIGKETKTHAKSVVNILVDVLADKNESIRRESIHTLSKIGSVVGIEVVLNPMAQNLENEKLELKSEILKFLLQHEEFIPHSKLFADGLVHCLCDKTKEIRSLAEKVVEKCWEIIGLGNLRSIAKDSKPSFIKELTAVLDRFDTKVRSRENSSDSRIQNDLTPKLCSPSPRNLTAHLDDHSRFPPPSNKKSSTGLNKTIGSIPRFPSSPDINAHSSHTNPKDIYEGEEWLAPLKTLISNRLQRV